MGRNLPFLLFFRMGPTLKGKNLLRKKQIHFVKSVHQFRSASSCRVANRSSQKAVPLWKKGGKHCGDLYV